MKISLIPTGPYAVQEISQANICTPVVPFALGEMIGGRQLILRPSKRFVLVVSLDIDAYCKFQGQIA